MASEMRVVALQAVNKPGYGGFEVVAVYGGPVGVQEGSIWPHWVDLVNALAPHGWDLWWHDGVPTTILHFKRDVQVS